MENVIEQIHLLQQMPDYVKAMQPYRPGKPIEELKEEYGFDKVIKLASNENPFGVSPKALAALHSALSDNYRYPDPISRRLRRKIAQTLGITPEELVVAGGSESLLAITVRSFLKPGEKALTGFGAFMGLDIYMSSHGAVLQKVPSPGYRFDVEGILAALTPDIKILYLPNPNNPTGSYFTHAELETIVKRVPLSTLILLDEAYIEFCGHLSDYPQALKLRQENVLILRTFSKAYGLAGLRVGYGIGHPQLIEQLAKVKLTFEPTLLGQIAAEAAWDDQDFLALCVQNNTTQLQRFYDTFDCLGLTYVRSAGNFVLVEGPDVQWVNALNEALLRQGIAIRPLAAFGFPHCVRITVGLPEENDALFAALETILPTL